MSVGPADSVASSIQREFTNSLAEARDGRDEDLGALFDRCRAYLLAIAESELSQELRGKVGASDLVQETMARGLNHFDQFRGGTQQEFAAWLRQILLNHLANVEKAFGTEKRAVAREQSIDSWIADPLQLLPGEEALRREEEARLEAALARLPEAHRCIVRMRYREKKSFADIAQALNKSDDAVGKLWARALQRLYRELRH